MPTREDRHRGDVAVEVAEPRRSGIDAHSLTRKRLYIQS